MTFLRTAVALAALLFFSSCTIESETILPDPTAAGEAIPGFPLDKPFRLETFEKDKGSYKAFATLTPERDGEAVRYSVAFDDGTPNRLAVQARKMSENNYLVRFSQMIDGTRPNLSESGLAFVTIRNSEYFLLSSITDDGQLEEMFGRDRLPRGAGTPTITLDTMAQAETISAWFAANYGKLAEYRDYTRLRVAGQQP